MILVEPLWLAEGVDASAVRLAEVRGRDALGDVESSGKRRIRRSLAVEGRDTLEFALDEVNKEESVD